MRTPRCAKRRFRDRWDRLYGSTKQGDIGYLSRALLAYQFCERDADGSPSDLARLGALWTADYQVHHRAFMRGFTKGGED
ncbi:hypothetical protein [Deinococcus radiotolerans]|uniref:Uncharacterized protein n=1 Tax=Deinococcus radiotolerans TaxID=1309407 RepID=A0ABQ2FQ85_9DEIO|nr:hypothetical protein [Deinococcus radiotolerans]GGL15905.1 hypothetical protein GCM10010844_38510 [Deinococcus radiotolerans]